MTHLKKLVYTYIENPLLDMSSYNLGIEYEKQGHTASAMGYFLRTAELTNDDTLAYSSLLHCANALHSQKNRMHSLTGCILHAMSILPKRPEAWYLYVRALEIKEDWQETYTNCCVALNVCDFSLQPLAGVEYPGKCGILFEKAVAAWRIGRSKECREIFSDLYHNHKLSANLYQLVLNNMNYLKIPMNKDILTTK